MKHRPRLALAGALLVMTEMKSERFLLVPMLALVAVLLLLWSGLAEGRAQGTNQVGLVVQLGDGSLVTRCIDFGEPEINGYDLLLHSGFNIAVSGDPTVGMAVCSIEGEGCPASDCFCECKGSSCTYWSYWHLVDEAWQYSSFGASGYMAAPGSVEGWRWGKGEPPPAIPFAEICVPPATDTPEPTATWTSSPTPEPTDTPSASPEPTATWTPSATLVPPTETPLPTDTPVPADTKVPAVAPTSGAPVALQSTPTPPPESGGSNQSPPEPTPAPDTSGQTQATALPEPAGATEPVPASPPAIPTDIMESLATPTQVPTIMASPTAEVLPTNTPRPVPTGVALAPKPDPAVEAGAVSADQGIGNRGGNSSFLTLLSVGVGMAYIFFVLFVIALAGLFVVVRLRQR